MGIPIVAYCPDGRPLDSFTNSVDDAFGNYEWTWLSEPKRVEEHLSSRPVIAIGVQLDSSSQLLAPVVDRLREWMPDLPVLGFVQDEGSTILQETFCGLQIYFAGKLSSVEHMLSQIERIFARISNGGMLRGSPGKLLHLMESEKRTCTVRLFTQGTQKAGTLFFVEGQIYDARILNNWGAQSACDILAWDEADIWVENVCRNRQRRIHPGLNSILVESIRIKDTATGPEERAPYQPSANREPGRQHQMFARIVSALEAATICDRSKISLFLDQEWPARLRQLASGSTVMGGRLRCGSFSLPEGDDVFFLTAPEPICIRLQGCSRRKRILEVLDQIGRSEA